MASYTFTLEAIPLGAGEISFDGVNYESYISSVVETITDRTLYARAKAGYRFKRFYIDGIGTRTDNPYHYGYQDTGFVSAYAEFEEGTPTTTYTASASANPSGWGTVKVGSAAAGSTSTLANITAGSTVTVVATPKTGYRFVSWSDGGAQTHDVTVNSDINLTATFEQAPVASVTITLVAHNGWGQVKFKDETPTTGKVSKTVPAGTSVTIEAVRINASFGYWQRGSGTHVQQQTYTFAPTANETIECYFYYYAFAITSQESAPDVRANVGEVRILVDNVAYGDWGTRADQRAYDGTYFRFEQRPASGGWEFVHWRYRTGYPYGNWMLYTGSIITLALNTIEIQAVFRRVPTHLLVNSSTMESPAKLVYDPTTNKLVADY